METDPNDLNEVEDSSNLDRIKTPRFNFPSVSKRWIVLIIILLAIPLTIVLALTTQNYRPRAAAPTEGEGRLTFSCTGADYVSCLSTQFDTSLAIETTPPSPSPLPNVSPSPSSSPFASPSSSPSSNPTLSPSLIQQRAKVIYDALSTPLSYLSYFTTYTAKPVTITLGIAKSKDGTGPRGAWAMVPSAGHITLYPRYFSASRNFKTYLITHESGHILAANSSVGKDLQARLYNEVYLKGLDSGCFNQYGVIQTYKLVPKSPIAETFAESIADTLLCQLGKNCNVGGGKVISDFPNTCSNTYNFIRGNVLGLTVPSVSPTSTPTSSPSGFQESAGQVTFEAEHYSSNISRNSHTWANGSDSLAVGGTYINTVDAGINSTPPNSAETQYGVYFTDPGTYYVWLRGYAFKGTSNAVGVGLDETPTTMPLNWPKYNSWLWNNSDANNAPVKINVTSVGLHTFSIWEKKDGTRVDRVMLTISSSAPSGVGSVESPELSTPTSSPTSAPSLAPATVNQNGEESFYSE